MVSPLSFGEGETQQTIEGDDMNQIQRFIDTIRDAPHDALVVAGMYIIPALIAL